MVKSKALYEEVIDEIGTQTLARFGLNIFSLNTYGAYGASVTATNIVSRTYDIRNKSANENETLEQKNIRVASSRGYVFEDLDVGQKNIMSELLNKGQKTYTTDELADIKKVADTGMTMIVVSHEMNFVKKCASRVLFIDNGKIALDGTPKEVFSNKDNERLREFLNKTNN